MRLRRFRVPVAMALGVSAGAAVLVGSYEQPVETVPVVMTSAEVSAGQVLTQAELTAQQVHRDAVPQGYEADMDHYLGSTLAVALPAGAMVLPNLLVGPGLLEGYPEGTVAMGVRPADTAMLGFLSPGQRVDVLASSDSPEQDAGTERIANNVPVLWVPQEGEDTWLGAATHGDHVVILALDPDTAADVAQASSGGRLHLNLVSQGT